ncbi:putative transposase [Sesbania bispinosa]|nr:putative transposase [Sesbania bispinosa]
MAMAVRESGEAEVFAWRKEQRKLGDLPSSQRSPFLLSFVSPCKTLPPHPESLTAMAIVDCDDARSELPIQEPTLTPVVATSQADVRKWRRRESKEAYIYI